MKRLLPRVNILTTLQIIPQGFYPKNIGIIANTTNLGRETDGKTNELIIVSNMCSPL